VQVPPHQALAAAQRRAPTPAAQPRLLIAGATGVLGNAVLRRLVGMQRHSHTRVLATLPMSPGMRQVSAQVVAGPVAQWQAEPLGHALPGDVAIVMFDPPRMFYDRERALWTPQPEQLGALGTWLKRSGVHTLAVVLPHAQGTLPEALKRGLANLDEHALAALGFERLLIVRTAQKPVDVVNRSAPEKLAAWMLGIFSFMVPSSEQPVRASKVAEFVDLALQHLPQGTWVAAPELVWRAAQGDGGQMRAVVREWLSGA
jgi:hypothetical protein